MTTYKRMVILGAGTGGLVAANELRRRLPRAHRILLVEKKARHAFPPSFLWLMTGDRRPEQITRHVRQLLRPGVELIEAEAQAIDLARRRVETSAGAFDYDYLIVALGAELAPETIPGLGEAARTFYTFHGALKLQQALQDFQGGKIAIVVAGLPYKCPAAPAEGAMLLADFFARRGLRHKVDLHLFTPEPQPMPVAGPQLGEAVRKMLQASGIAFHPLHKITAVDPEASQLSFEGKDPVSYDLLIAVPPHRAPQLVREAGLAQETGWVPVDPFTLATGHPNVYAIGDVTAISLPGRWKPDVPLMLPKAGVFAHAQAEVAAKRIAADISGAKARARFCGDGYCTLEAGQQKAGFASGNFYAEPSPQIALRNIGRTWHFGKVLFEKWWLAPYGVRRTALQLTLRLGGKALGIPVVLSAE